MKVLILALLSGSVITYTSAAHEGEDNSVTRAQCAGLAPTLYLKTEDHGPGALRFKNVRMTDELRAILDEINETAEEISLGRCFVGRENRVGFSITSVEPARGEVYSFTNSEGEPADIYGTIITILGDRPLSAIRASKTFLAATHSHRPISRVSGEARPDAGNDTSSGRGNVTYCADWALHYGNDHWMNISGDPAFHEEHTGLDLDPIDAK